MDMYIATEEAYKNGYDKGFEDGKNIIEPCWYCDNARLNEELTDSDDYHATCIGMCEKNYRIMLCSGWGKPLRIEFERWNEDRKYWETVGLYRPKHCPMCGRKIVEYDK